MKFDTDEEALEYLESQGFDTSFGKIKSRDSRLWLDLSDDEQAAITYLCMEWDYSWA